MIESLGFPKDSLIIEKSLQALPHVQKESVPLRRFDILVFAKEIHPEYALYPLLMVECKRGAIDEKAIEQVIGYNHYVKAYFIALAGQKEILLGWKSRQKGYTFQKGLLPFEELVRLAKKRD